MNAERLKSQLDCRTVASSYGVRIARRGGDNWSAHCFNGAAHANGDRNPSLSIGRDGFHCFACGTSGDVYTLIREIDSAAPDFRSALRIAADLAGVDLERAPRRAAPARKPRAAYVPAAARLVDVDAARLEVMGAIWSVVERAPFGDAATEWMEGRSISPMTAHGLGWRDWWTVREGVLEALAPFDVEAKQAAGLVSKSGWPWFPLAWLAREDTRALGVAVPAWHPAHPFPVAWRWRYVVPRTKRNGEPVKCDAPFGTMPCGGLLGLRHPEEVRRPWLTARPEGISPELWHPTEQQWVANPRPAPGCAKTLLITEGEPDWASVSECSDGRAVALSIVATGSFANGWPRDWLHVFRNVERVVIMVHVGKKGKGAAIAQSARNAAAAVRGDDFARDRVRQLLFPEGADANDYHQRGELRPLVEEALRT